MSFGKFLRFLKIRLANSQGKWVNELRALLVKK